MLKYIDIHTHKSGIDENVFALENITIDENFNLEIDHFYSIGLHPWYLEKEFKEQDFQDLEILSNSPQIIAIGEIGLDRMIETDFNLQIEMFERQLLLAEKVNKPVLIHCVKAFSEIISVKKRLKPRINMIIHGFNQNEQILVQLLKHNFFLSIGEAVLNPNSNAAMLIQQIPIECLFLETDDSNVSIKEIYQESAKILKISENELINQINQNFDRIFKF
jgi:TatD DNase family protein